jgi:hypothetical protein
MCTERVRPEDNKFFGSSATVPAVYIKAAVSPTIRPMDNMIPAKIPGIAVGKTILKTVLNLPAPKPKLPSRKISELPSRLLQ